MSARAWLFLSFFGWTSLWLGGTGGCGSALYINQVTRKASASVAAAEAVNAAEYAPYEYTLAVEYLHKAREEAAHADFQAANRFGRKAEVAADEARTLSVQRAANPDDTEWRPAPGTPDGPPLAEGAEGAAGAEDAEGAEGDPGTKEAGSGAAETGTENEAGTEAEAEAGTDADAAADGGAGATEAGSSKEDSP